MSLEVGPGFRDVFFGHSTRRLCRFEAPGPYGRLSKVSGRVFVPFLCVLSKLCSRQAGYVFVCFAAVVGCAGDSLFVRFLVLCGSCVSPLWRGDRRFFGWYCAVMKHLALEEVSMTAKRF